MSQFRTVVPIKPSRIKLEYNKPTMLIGSCFTENIGRKLVKDKFPAMVNPFGVLYNPASINACIQAIIANKNFSDTDLHFENGLWFSYQHHSSFSRASKTECLKGINSQQQKAHKQLQSAGALVVTLGTAWIYKLNATNNIIANCHKTPAKEFTRLQLSVSEIKTELATIIENVNAFNPALEIILTISPVRHWKDGAHGNQLSKAKLLLAIDEITKEHPQTQYFPSYEIVMDELRDYRFYEKDMLHVNEVASDYIYEKFADCFLDANTLQLRDSIRKIISASNHRPFNPETEQHQKFIKSQIDQIHKLNSAYPHINLSEELSFFQSSKIN